jgi:hypothetical protein
MVLSSFQSHLILKNGIKGQQCIVKALKASNALLGFKRPAMHCQPLKAFHSPSNALFLSSLPFPFHLYAILEGLASNSISLKLDQARSHLHH